MKGIDLRPKRLKTRLGSRFFIKAIVMPGFDAEGSHHEEPKEGVSEIVSVKVKPMHQEHEPLGREPLIYLCGDGVILCLLQR